jgi:hypothetical protein
MLREGFTSFDKRLTRIIAAPPSSKCRADPFAHAFYETWTGNIQGSPHRTTQRKDLTVRPLPDQIQPYKLLPPQVPATPKSMSAVNAQTFKPDCNWPPYEYGPAAESG